MRALIAAFILSLAFAATLQPAYAGKREIEALLDRASRPTMRQVLRAYDGKLPGRNPFSYYLRSEGRYTEQMNQLPDLAKVIAFMENAFPGATWAPLGRDAVIFGDLLEAFYLSIGQTGRVSRLNASGASFTDDDEIKVKFMEAAGLDLKHIRSTPPFVGLDRTAFRYSSQSANLIRAGYEAYVAQGGKAKDLVHRFNFLGLASGQPGSSMGGAMIEQYFANVTLQGNPEMISGIMQLQVGSWTDSLPWHDTFQELKEYADGRAVARPGSQNKLEYQKAILGEMISILKEVSNPKFLASVQAAARELNYEFPLKRPDYNQIEADRIKAEGRTVAERQRIAQAKARGYPDDMAARFQLLASTLPELPASLPRGYLTPNAQKLAFWLDGELKTYEKVAQAAPGPMRGFKTFQVPLHFIAEVTQLRKANRVSAKDYRRLVARAISAAGANGDPPTSFFKFFATIYDQEAVLQQTLSSKSAFFLTAYTENERSGMEYTEAVYRKIREYVMKMPIDCQDVYSNPLKEPEEVL